MNLSLASLLFALFAAAPALAAAQPVQRQAASTDLITRVYDLRSAVPVIDDNDTGGTRLAPALAPNADWEQRTARIEFGDDIASVLLTAFADEFEFEGRNFEMLEGQRARITAPASTHKEVAALIQFLEQTFRRSVALRVDWIERASDAPLAQPLLPLAEADKLVASATRARRSNLNVQPGCSASFAALRMYELISDYDVEIAQASTVADPIVATFQVGVQCGVRAAASNGGVWLAALLTDSELARPVRKLELDVGAVITTERGADAMSSPASVESISVLQGSFAVSLFVPDGQAAVIDLGVNLRTGARRGAIVIRREGSTPGPVASFALRGPATRVELLDTSWFAPPVLRYEGSLNELPMSQDLRDWWGEFQDVVYLNAADVWDFAQVLDDGGRSLNTLGPWLFATPVEPTAAPLAGSPALANPPPPECAGVWFRLRRGDQTVAGWGLPIVAGCKQRFSVGGETWSPLDASVEVAQSAATIDPHMGSRLDGVLGSLRCSRAQDGAWCFDLQVLAHILASNPTVISSGSVLRIDIERGEFDDLLFDERIVLGGPNGRRSRTIGMSGALELDVELR